MSTTTYLITGSSRSLGLGYLRQLLISSPSIRVIAAVRDPSNASQLDAAVSEFGKDRVYVLRCDVTDPKSTQEAARTLESSGFLMDGVLDALLANAGVLGGGMKTASHDEEDLTYCLSANLYGVINTVNAFLPFLRKGSKKQIFVTSSIVGRIGVDSPLAQAPYAAAYAISKGAVNMYTTKLAKELADDVFTVIPFHPGYVKTDMNGNVNGDLETDEATESATKNIFLRVTKEDNGKFLDWDGKELAW
ncbi:uncharacterized protein JCM6883_003320 [Sporobolomyces salmoneus]|uniref:uncharacterized protein n=1 Tax=Sporobolomyces salmoneus TaxID=183962 RepID=UPI003180F6CD